jgi:hypothetical protein
MFFLDHQYIFSYAKPLIGINVRRAHTNEFPFIVPIKFINDTNATPETDFFCTGTVVSKRYVLSVVHGLIQVPIHLLEIIVGSTDLRSGRKFHLLKLVTYEMWADYKNIPIERSINDISLIRVI